MDWIDDYDMVDDMLTCCLLFSPSCTGILFIILKLLDVLDWSWWWITSPFWIPFCVTLIVMGVGAIILLIRSLRKDKHGYKN